MPHPEHAVEAGFGPLARVRQSNAFGEAVEPAWSAHGGTQGLGIFASVIQGLLG